MSHINRGLPLASSRTEQVFPTLTPAQIRRIAAHGHMRATQSGEVLVEPGDTAVPFFVVVSGILIFSAHNSYFHINSRGSAIILSSQGARPGYISCSPFSLMPLIPLLGTSSHRHLSRTTSGLASSRSMRLECIVRKLRKPTAFESPSLVAAV